MLVLGPALGTSARALWSAAAARLAADLQVVAWDLPGHGSNPWVPEAGPDGQVPPDAVSVAGLARGVLAVVDALGGGGFDPPRFHVVGVEVGGAVALQLLLDAPQRVASATLLGTGARLGGDAGRQRRSETTEADATAYAAVRRALAGFDVRERLHEVRVPVLAVAGGADVAAPPSLLEEVASGVRDGRLVVLDGVGRLAPSEAREEVARLVRGHALGEPGELDRAAAALAADHAAGTVWDRPGLDRRTRSAVVLAAAVASGAHDDLAAQVRLARRHGLTEAEVREALLHAAFLAGAPASLAGVVEQALRGFEPEGRQ
nr:alpha/beta fold hydrolase [Nocardioides perillae]